MKYIISVLALLLLAGCATPVKRSPTDPDIVVAEAGQITAFGKSIEMCDISRVIRKQHLSSEHAVRILMQTKEGEDRRLMSGISSQMLESEHTRFYFVRPKSATSRVLLPGELLKNEKTESTPKIEIKR